MFVRAAARYRGKSEGERPFWISYADLMTAMMTLCLVVMAITIIAISRKLDRAVSADEIRARQILKICDEIRSSIGNRPGINVNCKDNRIDFGEAGRFAHDDFHLKSDATEALAILVPVVLEAADSPLGRKWFKQVIIEGYTDPTGPYLYNLFLSLERSYWVMCQLVDPAMNGPVGLTPAQVAEVRNLFLAGGVSFNDAKQSDEASRRVELRLQFYTKDEREQGSASRRASIHSAADDSCHLS
jgi:outer membrane protein OmpA-like peptidoglycan-associated protein